MPLVSFEGETFVAYLDISGFKYLMRNEDRAWRALDKFYNAGYLVLGIHRYDENVVDGLFVSIGTVPNSELVKDFVELNEWKEIVVGKKMETSQPGLYAAGDVTDACPEQVATAVGSGVAAAIAIDEYLQSLE